MSNDNELNSSPVTERGLLSAFIWDNNSIEEIGSLRAEHFYIRINSLIFKCINDLIDMGMVADAEGIASHSWEIISDETDYFSKKEDYIDFLEILKISSTGRSVRSMAKMVHLLALKRRSLDEFSDFCSDMKKDGYTYIPDKLEKVSEMTQDLYLEATGRKDEELLSLLSLLKSTKKHLDLARKSDKRMSGLSSGLSDLDKILGGFKGGELIVLGARPSMGKTALGVSMAFNVSKYLESLECDSKEKPCVLFFSLEMSGEQIASRIASMHTRISSRTFETGCIESEDRFKKMNDKDFKELCLKLDQIKSLPFFVDSGSILQISSIRTKLRKMHKRSKVPKLIIVDYLQLLKGETRRQDNRVQEISDITQGLKAIAREFNVPVIALSQLSRAVESREDKKPQLADLRESGTIEQDADVVMFLYRESYYKERSKPEDPELVLSKNHEDYHSKKEKYDKFMDELRGIENLGQVIVAKNRNGSIGVANLSFEREFLVFGNRVNDNAFNSTDSDYNPF